MNASAARATVLVFLLAAAAAPGQDGPPPGAKARPRIKSPLGPDVRYYVELVGGRGKARGHFSFTYNGKPGGPVGDVAGSIVLGVPIDPAEVDIHIRERSNRHGYRLTGNAIEFSFASNGRSFIGLPFQLDADRDVPVVVTLGGARNAFWITRGGLVNVAQVPMPPRPPAAKGKGKGGKGKAGAA